MDIQKPEFMNSFLELSVVLTGYSRFHLNGTGQAKLYFDTVNSVIGSALFGELLTAFREIQSKSDFHKDESLLSQQIRSDILGSEKLGPIARNIIKLWYVATWYELPKDWRDTYGTKANDRTFIPSHTAYPEGLLWPTIGVNPPGIKGLGYGTWSEPPLVNLPTQ